MVREPKIYAYDIPARLIAKHTSITGQEVLQEVLTSAIRSHAAYRALDGREASFYYVPISFHWGGKARASVAAILTYLRHAFPFFNASLKTTVPNHLLLFTGDLGMDAPRSRTFADPLPAELDVASVHRHFVALTLTGNPESGFQRGKDLVLPPTHSLKGGPSRSRDACCAQPPRQRTPHCKPSPRSLADSPWGVRAAPWPAQSRARALLGWAGQASGGGMGRHGGSGVRVRRWLAQVASQWPDALITDSKNVSHRQRNARLLPPSALHSTRPSDLKFGLVLPSSLALSRFCAAPFGRGNGWEGRSAEAVREGCIPLLIQPPGTVMALEPLVDWRRFAIVVGDEELRRAAAITTDAAAREAAQQVFGRRLHARLLGVTREQQRRMRCEMACAATHMSWGVGVPPASCALAARDGGEAQGNQPRHGVLATLLAILDSRARVARGEPPITARPCPCRSSSDAWHYFGPSSPGTATGT